MRAGFRLILSSLFSIALTSCATSPDPLTGWQGPETIAHIKYDAMKEISGLTASRLNPGILWTHNDSDGQPVIRAIDSQGQLRATVRVNGARNIDWEDIASFKLGGKSYLLIADVGDNNAVRTDCTLYVIAEPVLKASTAPQTLTAQVAWQIPVRYPDGPRDCESVAVAPIEGAIYLISKRTKPPVAYTLPLRPTDANTTMAKRVGELYGIPQPSGFLARIKIPTGLYRAQPCAFDISPDGRTAVVLTYGDIYLYRKAHDATWREAFSQSPLHLGSHGLRQAEAVCFSSDANQIFLTTEGPSAPLRRYTHHEKN